MAFSAFGLLTKSMTVTYGTTTNLATGSCETQTTFPESKLQNFTTWILEKKGQGCAPKETTLYDQLGSNKTVIITLPDAFSQLPCPSKYKSFGEFKQALKEQNTKIRILTKTTPEPANQWLGSTTLHISDPGCTIIRSLGLSLKTTAQGETAVPAIFIVNSSREIEEKWLYPLIDQSSMDDLACHLELSADQRPSGYLHQRGVTTEFKKTPQIAASTKKPFEDIAEFTACISAFSPQAFLGNEIVATKIQTVRQVIFFVPGAFTPTCSNIHLAGFAKVAAEIGKYGFGVSVCAKDTPVVMLQWLTRNNVFPQIGYISDPTLAIINSLGLAKEMGRLGVTAMRASIIIENGQVLMTSVDEDAKKCELSSGQSALEWLQENRALKA